MLLISRKTNESVHLTDENGNVIATITIMPQRRHGQTSLGINFQNNYKVFRDEILPENIRIFNN